MDEPEYKNGTTTTANTTTATTTTGSPKPKRTASGQMKRVSRACYNCRRRKSKCDLDSNGRPGQPPCKRCHNENLKCELGTSNRGGKRIRNTIKASAGALGASSAVPPPARPPETSISPQSTENYNQSRYISPYNEHDRYGPSEGHRDTSMDDDDDEDSTGESAIGSGALRNPSDAWQRLTNVAKRGTEAPRPEGGSGGRASTNGAGTRKGIFAYRLVENEVLTHSLVMQLITRYADNYHCYFPLVPRKYFNSACLDQFAEEKHLLTAVLTVASKDLTSIPHVHQGCSKYMLELISGIAAGADCDVEAVEALLILAEWEPQGLRPSIEPVGRGEEDRAAWMHVGIALRSGYFLGLDKTSFRNDAATGDTQADNRKRLAWASCYVSDRLISVRIGRAFWSRGPGPMTGLVSHDFPSLQPQSPHDEDYSKIFQAILDLTQLYGNVHDVLYSGMRTSRNMMLMGDYVKYIDDFRVAVSRWYRLWGKMPCASNLNVMLQMSYEYLKLYINAFAFQAAISQALHKPKGDDSVSQRDHLRAAFSNVASMQDSRFIYESVEAAKSYLTILTNYVDPERHLHFMPLRFYLYGIYAAVFLYKARSFGVLNQTEEATVQKMIDETIDRLRRASASNDDVGYRYARLLELLWKSKNSVSNPSISAITNGISSSNNTGNSASNNHSSSNNTNNNSSSSNNNNNNNSNSIFANTNTAASPNAVNSNSSSNNNSNNNNNSTGMNVMHESQPSNGMQHEVPVTCLPEPTYMQFSPANDFSWLDLGAVGDFVSGDLVPAAPLLGLDSFHTLDTGYQAENHDHGQQAWPPGGSEMSDVLLF
ncbi:TPA_exp: Uncharacterized protein A8136_3569 [Trichophyton benhamiae CBS 112371]|nr:TPA_exp: Uncharacterized protein A8136_3569 [Trichophyton benhamiae CBS 112371]